MLATSLPAYAPTLLCSVCSNLQQPVESVVGTRKVVELEALRVIRFDRDSYFILSHSIEGASPNPILSY